MSENGEARIRCRNMREKLLFIQSIVLGLHELRFLCVSIMRLADLQCILGQTISFVFFQSHHLQQGIKLISFYVRRPQSPGWGQSGSLDLRFGESDVS